MPVKDLLQMTVAELKSELGDLKELLAANNKRKAGTKARFRLSAKDAAYYRKRCGEIGAELARRDRKRRGVAERQKKRRPDWGDLRGSHGSVDCP
jgi:hypothetical protein